MRVASRQMSGDVADDLVGVLALGQPDDADVGEPDPGVADLDLADERVELGHPEGAGALAGRVDVVGEGDALRRSGSGARPGQA